MTGRDIIRSMVRVRWREGFCLPNYTPDQWWECDVFEITKAGYFREYEVKVSRSDFFADAKKEVERWPNGWAPGATKVVERKHDLLAAGSARGPSLFFYVTPAGLLQPHELPVWAGLIEVSQREGHSILIEREVTPAPRLHREKIADDIRRHALGVCYYRMHEVLNRHAA
jgi:hypothetical protein